VVGFGLSSCVYVLSLFVAHTCSGCYTVYVAIPPDFSAYGRKGARMRLRKLSSEQRSEIARHAALVRHQRATKEERSEAARRAVLARWAKAKGQRKSHRLVSREQRRRRDDSPV